MDKKFSILLVVLFLFNPINAEITLCDLDEINAVHKLINYTWNAPVVPRIAIKKMPEGIKDLSTKKRIRFLVRVLMPMILMENEKIQKEHDFVMSVATKENWNDGDIKVIEQIAVKYWIINESKELSSATEDEKNEIRYFLDHRIRPVPPSIAVGQAALESGWGTSRFVFEGNNIFGHAEKKPENGLKPKNWSGKQRNIRVFESLQDSISAYMLNLNRNRAYRKFRWLRRAYSNDTLKIAEGFGNYAIIKEEYIRRLQLIMTKYGLFKLNASKLDDNGSDKIFEKIKQAYIN
ncbi:MAG: glucosaminidase domain-containing protein [bacterium]